MFCKQAGLLSLETVGIDGTKMRAQNSQNNIYRREEIEKVQNKDTREDRGIFICTG